MAREESRRFYPSSWFVSWLGVAGRGLIQLTDTGEPVFLPFRMSAYVLTNLIVTGGMLTPGLQVGGFYFPPLGLGIG